jgi:hypothetical protein
MAQAGCHQPPRREPARGPQPNVKPAASTDLQPESRTAHDTVKATPAASQSGDHAAGLVDPHDVERVLPAPQAIK